MIKGKNINLKKTLVVTGLLATASPLASDGFLQVSLASTVSNQQMETTLDSADWGVNGTCKLVLTNGVLHVGPGTLSAKHLVKSKELNKGEVKQIQFDGIVVANKDSSSLFADFKNLTSFSGINNLDTSNVTTMSSMFFNDPSLNDLDLSSWNVSNVSNMSNMFKNSGIMNLNTVGWNTSKLYNINSMFASTQHLEEINLEHWNVSNLVNMRSLFDTSSVQQIQLSGWNVSQVTDMAKTFTNTPNLTSLDIHNWNTQKVKTLDGMFAHSGIHDVDLSNLNLQNAQFMIESFADTKITSIDASKWNVSNVKKMTSLFAGSPIDNINVSNWKLRGTNNLTNMFANTKLTKLDLSTWQTIASPSVRLNIYTDGIFASTPIMELHLPESLPLKNTKLVSNLGEHPQAEDRWIEKINDIESANLLNTHELEQKYSANAKRYSASFYRQVAYSPMETTLISNITVNTNLGTMTINDIAGKNGETIPVDIPEKDGYIADKKQVMVKISDNHFEVIDPMNSGFVTFSPIVNNSVKPIIPNKPNKPNKPSKPSDPDKKIITDHFKTITGHHQPKGYITLYTSELHLSNRNISNNTDWATDKKMEYKGKTYYRVSTDEWVNAEDLYEYTYMDNILTIKNDSDKQLINSKGHVSNRRLAKGTTWKTDRTIQINGKTYYRVSTDEFVSADDVIVK